MANLGEDLCWLDIGEHLSGSHRRAEGCWGWGGEGIQEEGRGWRRRWKVGSLSSQTEKRILKEGRHKMTSKKTLNISHTKRSPERGVTWDVKCQGGVAGREIDGERIAEG